MTMCFCLFIFFVSTLFPPKRGISPKRKRGITSTANNSWTGGYFGPGFVQGGRPGCPRFFDTPADPVGLLIEALDQILWKKIVKMGFVCVWGRPRGPWRLEEGGVSLLGTEEPSKQLLTQKKILNRGKGSQQSVDVIPLFGKIGVDVIPPLSSLFPFCVSAYGQSTLFPSSFLIHFENYSFE